MRHGDAGKTGSSARLVVNFPAKKACTCDFEPFSTVLTVKKDTQPDNIEDYLEELIDSGDIEGLAPRISSIDAGWVADGLAIRRIKEQEQLGEVIRAELEVSCMLIGTLALKLNL